MTTLPPEDNNGAETPQQPAQPAQPAPEPQAAPQYQAPPAGGYQQPAPGYQQPAAGGADPVSNIQLNYWLSVFFAWLPALIFWIIEKDKGNQRATAFHVSNLNFSLLRTAFSIVGWVLIVIPYIGLLIYWAAWVVLFVFHIMAAAKAANEYRNGGSTDPFIFNIPMVK